jgi:hypothetical protein
LNNGSTTGREDGIRRLSPIVNRHERHVTTIPPAFPTGSKNPR